MISNHSNQSKRLKVTVVALAIASAVGGAYSLGQRAPEQFSAIGNAHAAAEAPRTQPYAVTPGTALPDMASIVERNGPAVVNISITGTRKVAHSDAPFPGFERGDPFGEFFRRFGA